MNIEVAPKETEIKADWYNAVIYCQFLNVNGKTDWRMPTKEELKDIYNAENDFNDDFYWSSTEGNSSKVWLQDMYSGNQYFNGYKNYTFYVRAVRGFTK